MKETRTIEFEGALVEDNRLRTGARMMAASATRVPDVILMIALAVTGALGSYAVSQRIAPLVFEIGSLNIWFDSDLPRIFTDMNYRESELYTTLRHPLIPLIGYPPVFLARHVLGVDRVKAVRLTMAAVAALWASLMFTVLRLIGCRRQDALLFTLLGLTSSAALFWLAVPETLPFGSLTILCALAFVGLLRKWRLGPVWHAVVGAITMAASVSNWMIGLLATIVHRPVKQWLQIALSALALVTLLWAVQKTFFPGASFFLGSSDVHLPELESGGPLHVIPAFFFHAIVMPQIRTTHWDYIPDLDVMTVQPSFPGSGSPLGAVAALAWLALFGLGVWALVSQNVEGKLRIFIALALLGQLTLHLIWGRETFFYSMHYLPLLIVIAALVSLTPARTIGIVLAAVVVVFGGLNNFQKLAYATDFVHRQDTESQHLRIAARERPDAWWPRGADQRGIDQLGLLQPSLTDGRSVTSLHEWSPSPSAAHLVLGWPGAATTEKAYYEPGASFSPSVRSFGISIWITDATGHVQTTSDDIPIKLLHHGFSWTDGRPIPDVIAECLYYRADWSFPTPGKWVLAFGSKEMQNLQPALMVRSVGPAGGPITSLAWDGENLHINDRWTLHAEPQPRSVALGEESSGAWKTTDKHQWSGPSGWGYAKVELQPAQDYVFTVTDTKAPTPSEQNTSVSNTTLKLKVPDIRFAESLRAQAAHLQMGIVNGETRPGDPMSYPFAWLRDEAYIIVALARSGHLDLAKRLSRHLAENDFFGGTGAEGDAPGLGIWALSDVARQLDDHEYEALLWPHVRRKAEWIVAMLSAKQPLRKAPDGPVIPLYTKPLSSGDPDVSLIAEPAQDGLISGRLDRSKPVFYVNAISYRGLLDAADMAEHVGEKQVASAWRDQANQLQRAWLLKFQRSTPNEYWLGIWPAGLGESVKSRLASLLADKWTTYAGNGFDQAPRNNETVSFQAHQWLSLNRPDRAWTILSSFWDHQDIPGLYTWGTERTVENTFNLWKDVRGWLKGQEHVTPSYGTAAQILLLQLAMLADVDRTAPEPTLTIGAGVPPEWLHEAFEVEGISTGLGRVDWQWDGKELNVKVHGGPVAVRLGPAFTPQTPYHVRYESR